MAIATKAYIALTSEGLALEKFALLLEACDTIKTGVIVIDNLGKVVAINETATNEFWPKPKNPVGL
ncbi:MAG: hypothetical protein SCJ97_04220, partial [Bacillota bacterium]|nr:hypothetical protein [Bacillota bacterium]